MTVEHPIPILEPPEGWCNELFQVRDRDDGVAPIYRWYYCRLPKGHDSEWVHSCFASRAGR